MNKNDPDQFFTVQKDFHTTDTHIKGSKFLATVVHSGNKIDAEEKYQEIKKKYYDATHNCFAYRISENIFRFSDDGEPSGTAGIPLLKVLEYNQIFESLIIVTRYFGGTKLGAGGLVRAYSNAASECIKSCKIIRKIKYISMNLQIDYKRYNELLRLVNNFNGQLRQSDYNDKINLMIRIPKSKFSLFQKEFDMNFYDIDNIEKM